MLAFLSSVSMKIIVIIMQELQIRKKIIYLIGVLRIAI